MFVIGMYQTFYNMCIQNEERKRATSYQELYSTSLGRGRRTKTIILFTCVCVVVMAMLGMGGRGGEENNLICGFHGFLIRDLIISIVNNKITKIHLTYSLKINKRLEFYQKFV